ncbi:hypothetical protein OOT46_26980 [Aquabacterium sp. A7-Y]|uniref:hypothetical protein n=1 Tax=Aquabacterium sp. A7-Y TaxID=1349605 RepID=UPI00223CCA74|nr:hypothetical protein [Aquabacterium sp. A7-Y]MCW7541458.1 hypothetical protein [Aquabacterium sp. A7-Y]
MTKALCPACVDAAGNVLTGSYRAGCRECEARAVAHGPAWFAAEKANRVSLADAPEIYRHALHKVFGKDLEHWHQRVMLWGKRIKEARTIEGKA